ncbi:class I SAM-dependent methyltransferase [Burkholderia sp. Ac-20379]|uniref:class I SAM-dependent methyltransferase n=1 Tax=Burkholderia sp. Ac-20379 TaxID=2703900 RepID=UPI00197DA652|nr:class I SAM-dependent methyltransferase [Burkholderia sp. Ac-20379]MBN3722592.1 class I SAM-dependent methyltransferase [Burkholderia sp. Ac-20379]
MPTIPTSEFNIFDHNRIAWDRQAASRCEWSQPVGPDVIAAARRGDWNIHLTPNALPPHWLADVRAQRILCLASAGGQQAPVLAAAGADVTVFDASALQLEQDEMVARRDGLTLKCVQGDMRDLSVFAEASFDVIVHPVSNQYVPDVRPVWRECFRVLRAGGGRLLSSFFNPVVFVADRSPELSTQGLIRPRFSVPYSDVRDLTPAELARKQSSGDALIFGHSLSEQIGGQLEAGFVLKGFHEDKQPKPRFVIDNFLPTFLATFAVKL